MLTRCCSLIAPDRPVSLSLSSHTQTIMQQPKYPLIFLIRHSSPSHRLSPSFPIRSPPDSPPPIFLASFFTCPFHHHPLARSLLSPVLHVGLRDHSAPAAAVVFPSSDTRTLSLSLALVRSHTHTHTDRHTERQGERTPVAMSDAADACEASISLTLPSLGCGSEQTDHRLARERERQHE